MQPKPNPSDFTHNGELQQPHYDNAVRAWEKLEEMGEIIKNGRFSSSIVWYHRSMEMPTEGHRIIAMSPMYANNDPMKVRIIDSQFYKISKDAEWWAYINQPPVL